MLVFDEISRSLDSLSFFMYHLYVSFTASSLIFVCALSGHAHVPSNKLHILDSLVHILRVLPVLLMATRKDYKLLLKGTI